jgi:uncharacterized protein (UPF0335 family)
MPKKAGLGHNSGDDILDDSDEAIASAGAKAVSTDPQLRQLIERIERMEEDKKGIGDDIKDVYSEGKATGYDTKMMRKIIALRKMDPNDRREMGAMLETYKAALGMD